MEKASEKNKPLFDDCTRLQLLKLFDHDRKFERKFCDAILRAGEKRFPVHRAVLGLVSEYFENLFNVEMKEKFAPEININLPAENLERILDYIYTDVSGISTENALDLLEDAEYTQIGFLKAQCAKFILQMVDVENCLKLLAYAQRYNLAKIVDKANQVIYKNFTIVVHQDDFRQLKAGAMSAIIGHDKTKNQGETVFTAIIQWITFDPVVRRSSFVELFSQLDLSTFSGNFLRSSVVTEALVRENGQCSVAVMDALTNHLPPQVEETEATRVMLIGGENSKRQCVLLDVKNGQKEELPNQGETVFTAIIQWITFDPVVRRSSFVELFSQLDLSTLSGNFLRSSVVTEALVRENGQCCMAVMDALIHHVPQVEETEATRVMLIGGSNSKRQCVLLDVKNGQKEELPPLINDAVYATAVRMGNKIFVFGGDGAMRSCQMFDLTDRTWTTLVDIPEARRRAACAVLNGLIYLTGGYDDAGNASSTCFIYDPDNNSWSRALNMIKPRSYHAMVQFNGSLYVFGGDKGSYNSFCEKFTDNQWTAIRSMQEGRYSLAAVEVGGLLYAIGGLAGFKASASVERYDSRTNTWSKVQSMNVKRFCHGACVLQGKVYVVGGSWVNNKSVEVYDPQEDTWTVCFQTDDDVSYACIVAV